MFGVLSGLECLPLTQRIESMNSFFDKYVNKQTPLHVCLQSILERFHSLRLNIYWF
jgi:hypothetical protein